MSCLTPANQVCSNSKKWVPDMPEAACSKLVAVEKTRISPARAVLIYTTLWAGWLLLSEASAFELPPVKHAVTYTHLFFLTATAVLLYILVYHHARQIQESSETFRLARQEINKLAYYDQETGLPNHNLLLDRLNQVIAFNSRKGKKTAIIYISLTGFKTVVDARGHNGGGELVRGIAEKLTDTLRQYDTVARINRDEFVIVLGGTVMDGDLILVLNKLQAVFTRPLQLGDEEVIIPACFGLACFPADGVTSELLLQHAHIAMNQARQNGAMFQYYSEELNQKAIERHSIETGLLRAIDDGEFTLYYQPKMTIHGETMVGMEALVRWQKPGHGIISPDKFIPVAEENGQIIGLGSWVLREACRQNKAWQDAGLPRLKVAVNLSARQLQDNAFVPLVVQTLAETGLQPHYLELELTESALMGDTADTICKLLHLKEMGISISVDDFGTGYSSLSYLKHLPIDTIKVDRSFVRDIANDPDDAAIVDAIVAMAHSLHLNVVAEGVETLEQLAFLQRRNCQQAQGYYFARPLDPQQFEAFVVQGLSGGDLSISTPDMAPEQQHHKLPPEPDIEQHVFPETNAEYAGITAEYIGDIAMHVMPASPGDNLSAVLKRFQNEPSLLVLPIVDNGHAVGIINRSTFLEEHVIGMNGYAFHINHSKKMRDLMTPIKLKFEANMCIREAAKAIQAHELDVRVDNICITRNGIYHGIVDVNRFISAITDINLTLAKGANPLTGLPGNESIQREITKRLTSGKGFDIAYIDIDNFKPFNDYYGFQRGDVVIKKIGEIIANISRASDANFSCFCGHIGGDDFIIITGPGRSEALLAQVIGETETHLPFFHGEKDFSAGCYSTVNRKGEQETFGLLSLSIGIVNTQLTPVQSYAQLASISTEVKKAAKKLPGSSIVINRRASDSEPVHAMA